MSGSASADDVTFSMPRSYPPPVSASYQDGNTSRMQQTQSQVNEVVGIMRTNMEMVLDRDVKLSELDTRADALKDGAQRFEATATRIRRKYWWQNLKMWIILIIVILVIIIIIIVWAVMSQKNKEEKKP